jgi:hypothetical protein
MRCVALVDLMIGGRRVDKGCSVEIDASTAFDLMLRGEVEPDDRRLAVELGEPRGGVRFRKGAAPMRRKFS